MKIIVCETCFNIPKTTITNKHYVKLECSICNTTSNVELNYFNRFINVNENDDLFTLPNCNYRNHESNAVLYCFKCDKYLCHNCLDSHNELYRNKGHITINQKLSHKYFCSKRFHEENILNSFCIKCNNYLCRDCKCNHIDRDKYNFENDDENKIDKIKENIQQCEEILEREERYFNNMKQRLQNKINNLTNLFNDYKNRNSNLIRFFKLLLNNYDQIKNVNNYNIRNNIFLNNNFDLKNSIIYNGECLDSDYNRLSEFYRNTNHIKTQEFSNYYICPKYCVGKIKKCLFLNDNILAFCFDDNVEIQNHIMFIYKNKNNEYRRTRMFYKNFIKNIYPLKKDKYIYLEEDNKLVISSVKIDDNGIKSSTLLSFHDINFVTRDINNNTNNFFVISNSDKSPYFIIKYYSENLKQNSDKDYENNIENKENMYLVCKESKKFNKNLFENIKKIIDDSNVNAHEKNEINAIFRCENENDANI